MTDEGINGATIKDEGDDLDVGLEVTMCGQRDGVPVAMLRKRRAGTWTDADRATFLENLAATANVARSARAAGKSKDGAYRQRTRSIAFRRQWAAALAQGYARLEATLLDRAINGKRTTKRLPTGKTVVEMSYSDQLGIQLLTLHRRSVAEYEATIRPKREDPKVVRARMAKLIAKLVDGMEDRPAPDVAPPPALPAPDATP